MTSAPRVTVRAVLRRAGDDDGGFTIVELMIALLIFGIVMTGIVAGAMEALHVAQNNRIRSVAAYVAAEQLDTARGQGTTYLNAHLGRTTSAMTLSSINFRVVQDNSWVPVDATGAATSSCGITTLSGGTAVAYMRVSVSISWPQIGNVQPVTSQTIVRPPVGSTDPTQGQLGVKVVDRNGAAEPGQVVVLKGTSIPSQTTGDDGCAFFAYLTPGSYTVQLSAPANFVDNAERRAPSEQVVSVAGASVTNISVSWDNGATLTVTQTAPGLGAIPDNAAVTLGNTNLQIGFVTPPPPYSGASRTFTPLFPFTSGYTAWAGDCADADPGSFRATPLAVNPGAATSGTTALPTVIVSVQKHGPRTPIPGATITASHAVVGGCAVVNPLTYTGRVSDATGTVKIALPYGTWTLQSPNNTLQSGDTWPVVTLAPASPTPVVSTVMTVK